MIGKKVKVFWPVDEQWYTGVVQEYNITTGEHKLRYPDGDEEWVKIGESNSNGTTSAGGVSSSSPNTGMNLSGGGSGPMGGILGGTTSGSHSSPENRSPLVNDFHAFSGSPNKHHQMYAELLNPANFNPYHQPPPFGAMGMGGPFGGVGPGGAFGAGGAGPGGFHPHLESMRNAGMQFPPQFTLHQQHRMGMSPSRTRNRDSMSSVDQASPKDGSPHNMKNTPDSDKNGSGKKKSGPKTWSKEEDSQLLAMVQRMRMPIKWSLVSQSMPDRTGKQCRERYVNHLNPRLKNCDWSPAEDATIFHLYNTCGSQWAKMSKMIPGRTDNGIKNRFHNLRRQLEREDEHRIRLSKPDDFPDEVQLDKIREFPDHLRGKCDKLWDMSEGVGVLAAQSVLGGSFARNAGRFGPFRKAESDGEQCARCGLFAPSTQCGTQICTKTGWCEACTRLPPHMCSNILRECLNLRRIDEDAKDEQDSKMIKAGALNLALADAAK